MENNRDGEQPPLSDVNLSMMATASVLGAWAMICFHVSFSGRLDDLLHPIFQPLVVFAGGALAILSVLWLFLFEPAPPREVETWLRWLSRVGGTLLSMAVLIVPAVAAAGLAPVSFSEQALRNRLRTAGADLVMAATSESSRISLKERLAGSNPNQALELSVLELHLAARLPDTRQAVNGRLVRLVGQYFRDPLGREGFGLVRLRMFCCIADATPVGVFIAGKVPAEVSDQDWLEVVGETAITQPESGPAIPSLQAISVKPVAKPKRPILTQ